MSADFKHEVAGLNGEGILVAQLVEFLSLAGYKIRLEVSSMGQSVDLVATRGRWVTFIEAKVKDWRRAIKQCRAHESIADYICLALSIKTPPTELMEQVITSGYGLVLCDPTTRSCKWITRPKRNTGVWRPQRRKTMVAMRSIPYAD